MYVGSANGAIVSTIAGIGVPAEEFALAETLSRVPDIALETVEKRVSVVVPSSRLRDHSGSKTVGRALTAAIGRHA